MARVFAITTTATSVRLDAQGRVETSFTVSNASGRALRGRAEVRATNATQQSWLSIVGESERNFPASGTHQIVVRIAAPPATPAGQGSFRLDVVSAQNPDEDFAEGPTVTFDVPAPAAKAPFPWWIVIVAATVVVIIGALAAYLMMREPASQQAASSSSAPPSQSEPTVPCGQEKAIKSAESVTASSIEFLNSRSAAVKIYWLDFQGQRQLYATVLSGQTHKQGTFLTHPWVVTDTADVCLMISRPVQVSERVTIR